MNRTIPDPQTEPTLNPKRVADILGVSRSQVYAQIKADEIPSFRVGGRIVVPTAELLAKYPLAVATAAA